MRISTEDRRRTADHASRCSRCDREIGIAGAEVSYCHIVDARTQRRRARRVDEDRFHTGRSCGSVVRDNSVRLVDNWMSKTSEEINVGVAP